MSSAAISGKHFARVELELDHPDRLLQQCVTRPREFTTLAQYVDQFGRLYRYRIGATEDAIGQPIDINKSESEICFDVYTPPVTKEQREKKGWTKASAVSPGEQLILKLRRARASDVVSIKKFVCYATSVHWGEYTRSSLDDDIPSERRLLDTVGFIRCSVEGQFDRSLCVESEFNLKKHQLSMAM